MANEMGQTWEMWGQDPFLSGFWTPPEPEVSSFQGLGVTGKILWCLLDAFVPRIPAFEGTMSKDTSTLFSIRAWGQRNLHAHGTLATHQFILRLLGQDVLRGCSSNCLLPLTWYSSKRGIWASSLLVFPAVPLQASQEGYSWVSSELLFHVQSCFPKSKSSSLD